MRKLFVAGVAAMALLVAACLPPPPPPPPPPNPDRQVLLLGDSVGFGVGCILGHNAEDAAHNCPPQPSFSTWNGYLGACSVGQGLVLLYDHRAIEGNCNDPGTDYESGTMYNWPAAVDVVTPEVVVIVTGGWEIVDRWSSLPFGCDPMNAFSCAAPNRQMGSTDPALETNAINNYKTEMTNAINLIRSRPSDPEVLVLNMPYVDPDDPDLHGSGVWFESYDPTAPPVWSAPNAGTPYASSKVKVDRLNQAVLDLKATTFAADPSVEIFDFWSEFSPEGEFSMYVCPFPNNKDPLSTCAGSEVLVRAADRGHFTQAGNDLLGEYLIPKVEQMLGIGP